MKKIIFNNHYGLEDAVLAGTKTRTSRIFNVPLKRCGMNVGYFRFQKNKTVEFYDSDDDWISGSALSPKYTVGETVAIAQAYRECRDYVGDIIDNKSTKQSAGWNNKTLVKAEYMPHQIQITDIKLERLQNITEEDCLKEGIIEEDSFDEYNGCFDDTPYYFYNDEDMSDDTFSTAKKAFASLIDKINGKGIWNKNPWVWVYYFELIK